MLILLTFFLVSFKGLIIVSLTTRIKDLCDSRSISIAELERTVGLSNGQIRRWDKVSPRSESLQKVADYFNVSIDYLIGRTDIKEKADELESLAAHKDGLNLTPEEEEAIKRFVKHVLRNEE